MQLSKWMSGGKKNPIRKTEMEKTKEELKAHIAAVAENLEQIHSTVQSEITTGIKSALQASTISQPLDELPKLTSLINAHATKLGLIFKPTIAESTYKSCWSEIDSFLKYNAYLISLLNQIKEERSIMSEVFTNELLQQGLLTLESSIVLVNELNKLVDEEKEEHDNTSSDQRLIGVGVVWESCETLSKTSKSGSSGVLRLKLKQTNKLVLDALDELKEWLENPTAGGGFDFDADDIFGLNDSPKTEDQQVTEESDAEPVDDEVLQYGVVWSTKIQLVKLLISLLDKSIPASKYNTKFAKGLDVLNSTRLKINEFVDDLVACIVYDNDIEGAKAASKSLTKEINQVVEVVRKLNNDDEKKCKWLDSWKVKYEE